MFRLNQQTYLYLIQRYLMQKYQSAETWEKTNMIMNILSDLANLREMATTLLHHDDLLMCPYVNAIL